MMKTFFTFVLSAVLVLAGCQKEENELKENDVSSSEITIYSDYLFVNDELEINKFIKFMKRH